VAALKTAAEHPTARRSARVALAETYLRSGDADAADAERQRAAEVAADLPWFDPFLDAARAYRTGLQPRIDEALALLNNGRIEEAEGLMAEVLRDHPRSDEAHLTMGKVLIRAGAPDEAQKALRRAIELNPDLVSGYFLLAGAQMLRHDYDAARGNYLRTIELKPTHALAHLNLGNCLLKQGKRAKALGAFRDAVRHGPDLAAAHLELGALLLQDGEAAEALPHLETAVRLDGKNERARGLLDQARAKQKPPRP
jgi:tetratricopeptide (TPR) repeat protein